MKKQIAPHVGILGIAVALLFSISLRNGFVTDDWDEIVNNPLLRGSSHLTELLTRPVGLFQNTMGTFYRPVKALLDWSLFQVFGLRPMGWHLVSILLHLACALSVYFYLRAVFRKGGGYPLAGALLFAIHPVTTETVSWIAAMQDSLVLSLMLLSLLLIQSEGPRPRLRSAAAVLAFLVAIFTKEVAYVLPVFVVLQLLAWRTLRRRAGLVLTFLIAAGLGLVIRHRALGSLMGATTPFATADLLAGPKLTAKYLQLLFVPSRITVFYDVGPASSPAAAGFLLPLLLIAGVIGAAILLWRRGQPRLAIGMAWLLLPLLPAWKSSTYETGALIQTRYVYSSVVGVALLTAAGFDYAQRRFSVRSASAALAVILIPLMAYTLFLNTKWKSERELFSYNAHLHPRLHLPHYMLGVVELREQNYPAARRAFETAHSLAPSHVPSEYDLGVTQMLLGDYAHALALFEGMLRGGRGDLLVANAAANCYEKLDRLDAMEAILNQAYQADPRSPITLSNLARLYHRKGDRRRAEEFERAAESNRLHPPDASVSRITY